MAGQGGQLGDLSQLAQGAVGGPSEADIRLISETLGRTRDITSRNLEDLSAEGQARLSEQLASRGIQGASIESVDRAILERDLQRRGADVLDRSRIEANQALLQLPFQRAQVQLGANQTLLQGLLGAANPLLQGLTQERMAQGTQETTAPAFGAGDLLALGGAAAAPFTGGASLALTGAAGAGGAGGGGGAGAPTSLFGTFQSGLRVGSRQ